MPKLNKKPDSFMMQNALHRQSAMRFVMFSCCVMISIIVIGIVFWIVPIAIMIGFSCSIVMCYWSFYNQLGKNPRYWWFLWRTPIYLKTECSKQKYEDIRNYLDTLQHNKDYYIISSYECYTAHYTNDNDPNTMYHFSLKFRSKQDAVYYKLIWG